MQENEEASRLVVVVALARLGTLDPARLLALKLVVEQEEGLFAAVVKGGNYISQVIERDTGRIGE